MFSMCIFFFLSIFVYRTNSQDYHVLDFNATGDGSTDDTKAVRAALAAAAKTNGGRVIFDAGHTFLTGAFNITDNVILDVRGKILGSVDPVNYPIIPKLAWYGNDSRDGNQYCNEHQKQPIVYIYNATNVSITGGGTIDGQGPTWYPCRQSAFDPPCVPCGRPRLIMAHYSSNIKITNVTIKDSPFWTVHLAYASNVYVGNVVITSPDLFVDGIPIYLNTDGIDVDCSVNVTIENSAISTADDAIAIKAGWNYFGRTFGRASENVLVRNLSVGYSNGLCIGSEMSGGARNVTFTDIIINGSANGAILKTMLGRGGIIEDITWQNLQL